MDTIELTTPEGRITIVKDRIVSICEVTERKPAKTVIYTTADDDGFNVMESYDFVVAASL